MNFQQIVLLVAGIFLAIMFIVIIVSYTLLKKETKYPPIVGECPDFWEIGIDNADGKAKCFNPHQLGTSNCRNAMDFNDATYGGIGGNCEKAKWAKRCNLSWDGLTNNADVCSL